MGNLELKEREQAEQHHQPDDDTTIQQHYDREFNGIVNNLRDQEQDEGNKGADDTNKTDASKAPGMATGMAAAAGGIAGKVVKFIGSHRRGSAVTTLIVVIIILVALNLSSPFAILIAIKEVFSRFGLRDVDIGLSRRNAKIAKARYFGEPECTGGKFKCRHQKGVTAKDLKLLEKAGFTLEDKYERNGKTFYKTMSYLDADGTKVKINAADFEQAMRNNPNARARFLKAFSHRSFLARSSATLKKFAKWNIDRKAPMGDDKDTEQTRLKKIRSYFYRKMTLADLKKANVTGEEDQKDRVDAANGIQDDFENDVEKINEDAVNGEQKAENIADPRNLGGSEADLEALGETAEKTTKGAVKGAIAGILAGADAYCSTYQIVRTLAITAKILMVAQLAVYAMSFLTVADSLKAGDGLSGNVAAFAAAILLRPSKEPQTAGKTFSDSPGWIGMTQSGIIDRESMLRFTTGGAIMMYFNRLKQFMDFQGLSPKVCKHLNSWYGQAGLIIGGLVSSFFTGFSGAIVGALTGAAKGLLMGIALSYGTTLLAQLAASAAIPDPLKDKQGGYAAANAAASGAAALNGEMAKANGMPVQTKKGFAALQRQTFKEKQVAEQADAILAREAGVFSPTNPYSFQNQFALAMMPFTSKVINGSNLGSLLLNGNALVQTAMATVPNLFSRSTGAVQGIEANSLAAYRGDACPDEDIEKQDFVATFTCAEVRGPTQKGMKDTRDADPDMIIDYLIKQKQLDKETGEKGEELKKFQEVCVDSVTDPLTYDQLSLDGTNDDIKMCTDKKEKYQIYWTYFQDEPMINCYDDITEGKLCQGDADAEGVDNDAGAGNAPFGQDGKWQLVFNDEFNGTTLNEKKWVRCHPVMKPNCVGYGSDLTRFNMNHGNTPEVKVGGGALDLTVNRDGNGKYIGGMISTGEDKFGANQAGFKPQAFTYGYFEARLRVPPGKGIKTAWWMLPTVDNWPNTGEYDILEVEGSNPERGIFTAHWGPGNGGNHPLKFAFSDIPGANKQYKVYGFDWSKEGLKWYVDGQQVHAVNDAGAIKDTPFYLILDVAADNTIGPGPDGSTPIPSTLKADWVRVWKRQ